ncbi:hypothetical protein TeGR_g11699, partial [Tetraparma gracilis]
GLLLITRAGTAAILMVGYSTKAILWYTAVDVGFYLLVKIVRNDLINWFPIESTSVSIGSSLLIRIGAKIVTDYTCILHMRHSFEMGGLHFSLNTFVAVTMPFIVIFCVYEYAPTQPLMDAGVAWRIAGTLGACWFCNAVVLALVTKRDKWWTFWDPKTGAQDLIDRYREVIVNANDSFLPELFENNKRMWWPIRDEIKDHIQASWERWEDDCPECPPTWNQGPQRSRQQREDA